MRPTQLGFRSPKERTPDAVLPTVTYDGRKLSYFQRLNSISFAREKRFKVYELQAKNSNTKVGPGSYSPTIAKKIPGGYLYREFVGKKHIDDDGYFYVDNNLVFDSRMSRKIKQPFLNISETESPLNKNLFFSRNQTSYKSIRNDPSNKLLIFPSTKQRKANSKSDIMLKKKSKKKTKSYKVLSQLIDERFKY